MKRFGGDALIAALLGGVPAAVATHALAHDDMDYLAEDLNNFNRGFDAMSSDAQNAYLQITANNKLSGLDRALVGAALRGEIGPPKGIGTEGDRAVTQAAALRQQAPEIAAEVEQLNQVELQLIAREINQGTTPQAVITAEQQGAGVTPVPALVGGTLGSIALGTLATRGNQKK